MKVGEKGKGIKHASTFMLAFWYRGRAWSVQLQLNGFAYRLGFLG